MPGSKPIRPCTRGDGKHLAALVETAVWANPVGHVRGGALRTGAQLWQGEDAVVGATLAHPAAGRFSFGYTHML